MPKKRKRKYLHHVGKHSKKGWKTDRARHSQEKWEVDYRRKKSAIF